jgi:hypothetical protein
MSGNTATVYRTKLTLSGATALNGTSNRTRASNDDVAQVTFNNIGASELTVSTVIVQLSGIALKGDGQNSFDVRLLKGDNEAFGSVTNPSTCTTGIDENNSCSVTFSPAFALSGNASQTVKVRLNSGSFFNATSTGAEGLSVFISATTDVAWNDGTTGSIPLEAGAVPFTLADVTYN